MEGVGERSEGQSHLCQLTGTGFLSLLSDRVSPAQGRKGRGNVKTLEIRRIAFKTDSLENGRPGF